jgi:predicted metalloprotease with PDZ domain
MNAEKKDENSWLIKDAKNIGRISYWVEDSWDTEQKEKFVFEPAGTNIEQNENFVINTHGFFGYFEGMKTVPYRLAISKPNGFYGSTGLNNITYEGEKDIYSIPNYMELADSPIMYNRPDTTVLNVGGTRVLVSVYSREQKKYSGRLGKEISRLEYLGGKLPVDKYAFIMYLFKGESRSGASGALEHSYSSVYFIPEMEEENLIQTVIDFSAHEFFHIVTPLNIHSEEIGNFDFNNPVMSRHGCMKV